MIITKTITMCDVTGREAPCLQLSPDLHYYLSHEGAVGFIQRILGWSLIDIQGGRERLLETLERLSREAKTSVEEDSAIAIAITEEERLRLMRLIENAEKHWGLS